MLNVIICIGTVNVRCWVFDSTTWSMVEGYGDLASMLVVSLV